MQRLKDRIQAEGQNLGSGILKIDSILNHQIDPQLMFDMGIAMAEKFRHLNVQRILTAEISGICPALTTGYALGVPVVYARKLKPITMSGPVYLETAPSHTKGTQVNLLVAAEFLHAGENVLIVDDFLASGKTLAALARMVRSARANLVGAGVVVEKSFEEGRAFMKSQQFDVPIESLVIITSMDDGQIIMQ